MGYVSLASGYNRKTSADLGTKALIMDVVANQCESLSFHVSFEKTQNSQL